MILGYRISNSWAGNLWGQSYDDVTFGVVGDAGVNAHTVAIIAPSPPSAATAAISPPTVVIT